MTINNLSGDLTTRQIIIVFIMAFMIFASGFWLAWDVQKIEIEHQSKLISRMRTSNKEMSKTIEEQSEEIEELTEKVSNYNAEIQKAIEYNEGF